MNFVDGSMSELSPENLFKLLIVIGTLIAAFIVILDVGLGSC